MNFSEAINLLFLMTFVDITKSYSLVNTRKGSLCMTECQPYNGYYWCYYDYVVYEEYSFSNKKTSTSSHKYLWEYCSPNETITTYGKKCLNDCGSYGYGYTWCKTSDGWDYCSLSNTDFSNMFVTKTYKQFCIDECGTRGEQYKWCYTHKGWDYCSFNDNYFDKKVIVSSEYKALCLNPCETRGYSYYWCETFRGWDYCSKDNDFMIIGNKAFGNSANHEKIDIQFVIFLILISFYNIYE